ncbi:MAG: peptidase fungalysin [Marmoricola sp.]|nr:peptidase fungalysin [Marmoricola sp.]
MSTKPLRLLGVATVTVLIAGLAQTSGQAASAAPRLSDALTSTLEGATAGLADVDTRGVALPSATQKSAAAALGGQVRWNDFGTPATISPLTGTLGKASSTDAVAAARSWLGAHANLFGLSAAQLTGLTLVRNQKLAGSEARAVLFRQDFGGPAPALDSMVTVGIGGGAVQYVSSSLVRTSKPVPAATLSPAAAWIKAAANVGRTVPTTALDKLTDKLGWTRFKVAGFAQEQQVRLRSLAYADGTVRPVFEANVVDVKGGSASAYTLLVDGVSGKILVRQNKVDQSSDAFQFQGTVTATACGPKHQFELKDANTKSIVATAAEAITTNDIEVKILSPSGALLASGDTATSPEVATYTAASIPQGIYSMQVCPYADPTAPFIAPGTYAAGVTTSDSGAPTTPTLGNPKWRYFAANPSLDWSPTTTPTNTVVGCWTAATGCTTPTGPFRNVAAAGPWDFVAKTGTPTFTTTGNNAVTHEAWLDPDAPGGLLQAPISATREYTEAFKDAWNNSKCSPTQLVPGGNDINASVTNLFVAHNRMHDFAYYLGFTEDNYNLQTDNLGRNDDPTRGNDPEIGNAQAGAISGGQPTYLGRDNANQIALQDGIPGITNQYLFQPIAGSFYSPCTDGALDMSIVGHEYTHAISNRMIGGPDEGITSEQGGAMGESWGDLTAGEYMFEHGYSNGANPWAVGPYATGNKVTGIRDYAIDQNPLNYSDYGFDTTGAEVHADGEIWNGTMWEVRKALVAKYDAQYPSTDKALNLRCAQATATSTPTPATQCPGNRRWLQLVFDGFLLQQGATSMLDARDAMLAADRMRFGGANQAALWDAFARRGMGSNASTPDADSGDPTPGFASPKSTPATVKVVATVPAGSPAAVGKAYIGDYEARATPVADTDPKTALPDTAQLTAGTYDVVFAAPGYGLTRGTITVTAGQKVTKTLALKPNLASAKNGASVLTSSAGSLNAGALIDDTEATNWAGVNASASVDASSPYVAVDLAGSAPRTISSVRVSALLRPADPAPSDGLPLLADDDPDSGARFTALRRFAVEVCTTGCSAANATWKRIYTSAADAFPGTAPRPVAPNQTLRTFDVPDTTASAVRLVALENQCTGAAAYAGEQDSDPLNDTDCKAASDADLSVRASEFQVF